MKLCLTLIALCLFAQTSALAAIHSGYDSGTSNVVYETGFAECDVDCSVATTTAEIQATAAAEQACQSTVHRVSDWQIAVKNYGRLFAVAAFSCDRPAAQ